MARGAADAKPPAMLLGGPAGEGPASLGARGSLAAPDPHGTALSTGAARILLSVALVPSPGGPSPA